MLEDRALTNDCNVLVVSFAEASPGRRTRASLNYRWIGPEGGVVDTRTDVTISVPPGCRNADDWLQRVLGEIILALR